MATVLYSVKKGDTLWSIATTYASSIAGSTTQQKVNTLVRLNNIADPDFIVVGQLLKFSGTEPEPVVNTTPRAVINVFGLQANTDRTVYATWTWSQTNTKNYQTLWSYDTGDGVWFVGSDSTVESNQSIYNAPENAKRVKFKMRPLAETYNAGDFDIVYWVAEWSTEKIYDFSNNPPSKPSVPTVTIEQYTLTAELTNLDLNATGIQFQIVKNDSTVFNTGTATIITNSASYSCKVDASGEYKVRCRSYRGGIYSDWSEYSDNVHTVPSAPTEITVCRALSSDSVYLEWVPVTAADTYDIEYTTEKEYFDTSDQTTTRSGLELSRYTVVNIETGKEYFFRVRAVNDKGSSAWSSIKSVVIGKEPAAPTTWSNVSSVIVGESLTLYWVHNSEDGSKWTYSDLDLYVDGIQQSIHDIANPNQDEDSEDYSSGSYSIDTSVFTEGTTLEWRVRTAGVTMEYGDWSVQRTIYIYAPPVLELSVTDVNGNPIEMLSSFPFYVYGLAGPNTQTPIGYYLSITANEGYETVDNVGNIMRVNPGEQVYFRHFDITDALTVELSAQHVNLENNIEYTINCIVSMDSGLSAQETCPFTVAWTDEEYAPNADIGIDKENYTASIRPYCEDARKRLIEGVVLSVYRREYDGKFVELATGLVNTRKTFITDPHPSLDFARYRVVATSTATGAVSYIDISTPVGGIAAILQWGEYRNGFELCDTDSPEQSPLSGSILRLPYNIDVSDQYDPDVSLVKYIGREHPVGYYGTQKGVSSVWNVAIAWNDRETLYALRRLAIWPGDVYVREPSGSGYWANVKVSFSQKHLDLIIPVTLDITRVDGTERAISSPALYRSSWEGGSY